MWTRAWYVHGCEGLMLPWTRAEIVYAPRQVSKLLQYSPTTRLKALDALTHPFFDELRDPATRMPNGAFATARSMQVTTTASCCTRLRCTNGVKLGAEARHRILRSGWGNTETEPIAVRSDSMAARH